MKAAHLALLRQPWQVRRAREHPAVTLGWLPLLALPAAWLAWQRGIPWPQFLGALGIVFLTVLWTAQVGGLLRQNRPELARLLPGQLTTLRQSLLLQTLLFAGAAWACLSLALGPRAEWPWLVLPAMLLIAWSLRQPWLWLPIALLPLLPWSLRALLQPLLAGPVALQFALLAVMVVAVVAVLGDGNVAHRRRFAWQQRWQASLRAQGEGRPAPVVHGPWLRRLGLPFTWPQRLAREALLRRAPGHALARLDLGLQVGGQAPMLLWIAACIAAALAVAATAVAWRVPGIDWAGVIDQGRLGLCIGLFSLLCSPLTDRPSALWRRRREQALLVLLPGPPAGAALAAALERRWRHEHLVLWSLASAVVLGLCSLGGPGTLQFGAAFAAACLPLGWVAQALHRRLRSAPSGWRALAVAPALATLPALWAQAAEVPALASLAAGGVVYALCAAASRAPGRALLPLGR